MAELRKIAVAPGIVWVEAPDADLRVLCGCPGDAVKHLMHQGMISEVRRDGVLFETGPNAILLSDVAMQNGVFCNLAEFPVLQMLYRQGTFLPGHPNNSGRRPLLIGRADHVASQLQYIHRGNYGLSSDRELIGAGVSPDLARDLMACKLHFAFGRIRHPRELLDARELGARPVILRGGVALRRLEPNRFEFRHNGGRVEVDLSIAPGEGCPPPYSLGLRKIERDCFSVVHSGGGDGWDPDRPSMASVVIFHGKVYLVDAGPNVLYSLQALGIGRDEIDGLFHTHCHDDHFAGLISLLDREKPLRYFATPLVRASVMKKLAALRARPEDEVQRLFDRNDLACDRWTDVDGLEGKALLSPHPVETSVLLFRAMWQGRYRSYAHFADIVSLQVLRDMVDGAGGSGGLSRAFYDKVVEDYATEADVKKIDIGGGLIHGSAEDFRYDRSRKLVLAHVARPLSPAERGVGCEMPFGAVDVMIPGACRCGDTPAASCPA
ncbi:MAG: MBL fold metallo-hydrolase [Telmatospirillum sp.]|nr:MBL fold metallo-hydrolase [Telmatospirillum sp.]